MPLENGDQPPAEQREIEHDERDEDSRVEQSVRSFEPPSAMTSTPRMPISSTGMASSDASADWPLYARPTLGKLNESSAAAAERGSDGRAE